MTTSECPPEDELVRMVEGALGDASLAKLERHVDTCEHCAAVIANLGALDGKRARVVGRYQLDRRIGGGGMGEVWAAWDPQLRRDIAVKLVKPERADDGREKERLLREARALARLTHPNVLAVYDVGETDQGEVFIATELVVGDTLASRGGANADWRALAKLYVQAARGLAAAHGAGLVHRDVKPANLLIGTDGRVRVADFGLAVRATTTEQSPSDDKITQTGYIAGTPAYMAPEQRLGEPADARADQYALCVALVEGIAGRRPPLDIDADALIVFVEERRPREPELDALCRVLARGLSIDRTDRYRDADALADAIEACFAPSTTSPVETPPKRSRRAYVIAGGAALAGVAAVLAGARMFDEEPAPAPVVVAAPDVAIAIDAHVAVAPMLDAAPAPIPKTVKPPPAPTLAPDVREQVDLALAAARRAMNKRDGKACLAILDKLPSRMTAMTQHHIDFHRGQCEMLAGDCERGVQRVDDALDGMGSPKTGKDLAISLCPVGGPFETRLRQITLQGHQQKTPAACRAFLPHARKVGSDATEASHKALVAGVLRHLATCIGECAQAEAIWKEAHALDGLPIPMQLEKCVTAAPATPAANPVAEYTAVLGKAQQGILRRDLRACRELKTAAVPQGLEQSANIILGYCEMVAGNCKAGEELLVKAYGPQAPTSTMADTYCPITGSLDERLRRVQSQLLAFADMRSPSPAIAWCNHLIAPAKAAAGEAQSAAQRSLAAKLLNHLAWCESTVGKCSEAGELAALAAATDANARPVTLAAKCP